MKVTCVMFLNADGEKHPLVTFDIDVSSDDNVKMRQVLNFERDQLQMITFDYFLEGADVPQPTLTKLSNLIEAKEAFAEIRDFARTGLKPDVFDYTNEQWLQHKLNKCAAIADSFLS